MEAIKYIINTYQIEVFIFNCAFILLILVILLIQSFKIKKLKRVYKNMFKGESVDNIEDMLLKQKNQINDIKENNHDIIRKIEMLNNNVEKCFSKSVLYKYDAFNENAGKLSFVYVLLDKTNTGIILNGIYSSNGHYIYSKEIINGKTDKELSKEENLALNEAIKK